MRVRAMRRRTRSARLAHWRPQYLRLSVPSTRRPHVAQMLNGAVSPPFVVTSRASAAMLGSAGKSEISADGFPLPFIHQTLATGNVAAITVNRDSA